LTFGFQFDSAHRVMRCTFTGPITYEGLREYCKAVALHIRRADPVAVVLDFTPASTSKLFYGTVKALVDLQSGVPDRSPRQFIVAPTESLYGFARMYQILAEQTHPRLQVVHSLAEAYAAMRIEAPNFESMPDDGQRDL